MLAKRLNFNVWSEQKLTEKLDYLHRNPVQRGLVARPGDWAWSSSRHYSRHYATGEDCAVESESHWTARRREQLGMHPMVRRRATS
jgi:putative transposase